MYRYDYLALLDIDEAIVPLKFDSWNSIMADAESADYSSYCFRNVYFMDEMLQQRNGGPFKGTVICIILDLFITYQNSDIPPYLHMLQHVAKMYRPVGIR